MNYNKLFKMNNSKFRPKCLNCKNFLKTGRNSSVGQCKVLNSIISKEQSCDKFMHKNK